MSIVLSILVLLGSFLVALVCASFLTPLVLKALNKIVEYSTHIPQNKTYPRKYSIYIPRPVQQIRSFLNLHNHKSSIVKTDSVENLNSSCGKIQVNNSLNTVRRPLPKLNKNPAQYHCHFKDTIRRGR